MLRWLLPPACVGCRRLLREDASAGLCSGCAPEVVPTEPGNVGAFSHEGPLRRALSALKYDRDLARVGPLAALLHARLAASRFDLAVAVPLHIRRQRSRGFNQSDALLRAALRGIGKPAPRPALRRIRPTAPQVGLSGSARRDNVVGAFDLHPRHSADLPGQTVLLFDDVVTTGATLQAAAAPLRAAGARVTCLALLQAVA